MSHGDQVFLLIEEPFTGENVARSVRQKLHQGGGFWGFGGGFRAYLDPKSM